MTTLKELAEIIVEEKLAWDRARIALEKAKSEYDFAERRLVLANERYRVEHLAHPDPLSEGVIPLELSHVLETVQYLGFSLKAACRWVLEGFGAASAEEIADRLEEGGFQFKSDVPVREVHAALLKQPWAKKNQETGMWEYEDVLPVWHPHDPRRPL
jgi:hypothetical protein